MRLTRFQRVGLLILGLATLGTGVAGSIMDVGAAGVLGLILPGLLLIIGAIVGVAPNMNLKEGSIDWPEPPEPTEVEHVVDRTGDEIAQLRDELAEQRTHLEITSSPTGRRRMMD